MRFPWLKRKAPPPQIVELQAEIDEAGRSIESLKPVVEEAIRRTNESYIAVEQKTERAKRRVSIEYAFIRDLEEGWGKNHG